MSLDRPALAFRRPDRSMAREIRSLWQACADDLTRRFGNGHWSGVRTLPTIREHCDDDALLMRVGLEAGAVVATFTLRPKKPTFISKRRFADPATPFLWLTDFFVHPSRQRQGLGRRCLDEIRAVARQHGADWVRFDAYAAPAGASAFYEKCGCTRIDETVFRGVGLHVFETAAKPVSGGGREVSP